MTGKRQGAAIGRAGATALICTVVVFGMVGLSFAAVPLYRIFCQVTGFGGTTQRVDSGADHVLKREITVRFDGNVRGGLGWHFAPKERLVRLKIGETGMIAYRAINNTGRPSVGTATFNVTPTQVGQYFNKIACFCFTEQRLEPGQGIDMPVTFFIDPRIADDPSLDYVDTITLSYSFYPSDRDGAPVAALPADDPSL